MSLCDSDNDSGAELLSALADEFSREVRRGEQPSIDQYAARYPELAVEIRRLFPALLLIEQFDPLTDTVRPGRQDRTDRWRLVPDRLGEYRILNCLGCGGMGIVYEAIQESLGRHVALKVLPISDASDVRLLERFRREAHAAARLHHTNIVPVFGVGEDAGVYYYVMQYIRGSSVDQILSELRRRQEAQDDVSGAASLALARRNEPNSAHEACSGLVKLCDEMGGYCRAIARLGVEAADALSYAHEHGVLHRDIKPANLLLDTLGTLWIADFGLAQVDGLTDLTRTEDILGTLCYIPPERFRGQSDERGDVYSLGLTLLEMLTLRPAFPKASRAELIRRMLHSAPCTAELGKSECPRDLVTIVLKAIAHEPYQRYQSAGDMADDLRRFLADRPIHARRQSTAERFARWCRHNPWLAAMTSATAALLLAISVLSLATSARLRDQLHETLQAQREGRRQMFAATLAQAKANRKSGEAGQRFQTLRILRQAKVMADELQLSEDAIESVRSEAIASLCLVDAEPEYTLAARPPGTASLDFDPSLKRYARIGTGGDITIHRVPDNSILMHVPAPGTGFRAALRGAVIFSADGTLLQQLCISPSGNLNLRLWDLDGSSPELIFARAGGMVGPIALHAHNRSVAVLMKDPVAGASKNRTADCRVHVFDIITGTERAEPISADVTSQLAFHPTLPQLAVSDALAVRIIDLDQGDELQRWERPDTTCLGWSHDGRQLVAAVARDTHVFRWNVMRKQELAPLIRHADHPVESFAFDPAGKIIVTATRLDWRMWNALSGQLLWKSTSPLPNLRFSSDGKLFAGIYRVDPNVAVLRVAVGDELERLDLDAQFDTGSPRAVLRDDGRLLAATARRGTVLWDVARREEVGFLAGDRIPLVFETNGKLLTHADAPEGVVRWSVEADPADPERYRLIADASLYSRDESGVLQQMCGRFAWSASADGRVIAMPHARHGATVFTATTGAAGAVAEYRPIELGPQYDVLWTSVSPNGEWVATGSANWLAKETDPVTVTVWESGTGKRVKELLSGHTGVPKFSPDGAWIAVLSGAFPSGIRLWHVGSWQDGPAIAPVTGPGGVTDIAFDVQRNVLAVQGGSIRLLDAETGHDLGWIGVPDKTSLAPQCFTPDGTRLFAFDVYEGRLDIWDIRAIRSQLAELGLDFRR